MLLQDGVLIAYHRATSSPHGHDAKASGIVFYGFSSYQSTGRGSSSNVPWPTQVKPHFSMTRRDPALSRKWLQVNRRGVQF